MRHPPKKGPALRGAGRNDPNPISKAEESYGNGSTGADPKGRCAALTRHGHRCQNRATGGGR